MLIVRQVSNFADFATNNIKYVDFFRFESVERVCSKLGTCKQGLPSLGQWANLSDFKRGFSILEQNGGWHDNLTKLQKLIESSISPTNHFCKIAPTSKWLGIIVRTKVGRGQPQLGCGCSRRRVCRRLWCTRGRHDGEPTGSPKL